jgi:hypothetical protein
VKIGQIHVAKNRTYSCCVDTSQPVLDIFFCYDLYFLTIVGWANGDKDAQPTSTAEN